MEVPIEKLICKEIVKKNNTTISKLGLRFDKVAIRFLLHLRLKISAKVNSNQAIVFVITAPIFLPSKTENELMSKIDYSIQNETKDKVHTWLINNNVIKYRFIHHSGSFKHKVLGLVHNKNIDSNQILELLEQWLNENRKD